MVDWIVYVMHFLYFQLKLTVLAVKLCNQYFFTKDEGIAHNARNLLSSTLQKYAVTQRQKENAQQVSPRISFDHSEDTNCSEHHRQLHT